MEDLITYNGPTIRLGIDDLKSIYAFYGSSQGDTTQTNDLLEYQSKIIHVTNQIYPSWVPELRIIANLCARGLMLRFFLMLPNGQRQLPRLTPAATTNDDSGMVIYLAFDAPKAHAQYNFSAQCFGHTYFRKNI